MNNVPANDQEAKHAVDYISSRFNKHPQHGIVLGTGSGIVADQIQIDVELDYKDIPGFPKSTALGHKGNLICGSLADQPVVAMNGRFHLYEGHSVDRATLPIRVMQQLGVETLFITNASGGINPNFRSGDIMAISSHIDLMCRTSSKSSVNCQHERPTARSDRYDTALIEAAKTCARKNDFILHVGTYAGLLGPNYETRAEYRMLRRIGADVAGMSTVPEVYVANLMGLKILGLSVVTNVAKPDVLEETSGQEVVDAAELAAPRIYKIVSEIINHFG